MKQNIISLLFILLSMNTSFAQEEKGEGDIFIENNPEAIYTTKHHSTVKGVDVSTNQNPDSYTYTYTSSEPTETHYTVDYLFTSLAFDEVKKTAKTTNKPYFIDFTADWCAPCKMMDKTTFRDYNVVEYAKKHFIAVQLDMSDFDAIELQAMYNIKSLPTILFFDSLGNLIGRTTGLQTGTLFYQKLQEMNNFF